MLQGWDAIAVQIDEQRSACHALGTSGHLVALTRIDQSWEPRIVRIPPRAPTPGEPR
ncbi:MAG: hypothetical protein HYR85_08200 [Planctomycetes bacterium]|nr:hypothetical protein [Planctomycetota bacterium]